MRFAKLLFGLMGLCLLATRPAGAMVSIQINLATQTMSISSASGAQYEWAVSTARAGYITPRGTFRPQQLIRMAYSFKYNMAPMPHSIFFAGNYAIHGTEEVGHLGRPASHGCIRLAPAHAATLYAMVRQEGATISIFGTPPGGGLYVASHKHHGTATVMARHHHHHAHLTAFAYAPQTHHHSLRLWLQNPLDFWPGDTH